MPPVVRSNVLGLIPPFVSAIAALILWSFLAGGRVTALEMQNEQNKADIAEIRGMLRDHLRDQEQVRNLMHSIDNRLAELTARQEELHRR